MSQLRVSQDFSVLPQSPVRRSAPFRLDPAFLAKYATQPPPFGFNGLGHFVYLRTYSRLRPDGTKENWAQTVERVVNGTYNMQKDWNESNDLGWKPLKAQRSAQEMYDRIFTLKFTPPGRGLWAMGSTITEERGLFASLNNCFAAETEVITKQGIKTLGELSGATATLLTTNKRWIEAPVNSFGVQELFKITLQRNGCQTKEVYATANHRWFAKSVHDAACGHPFRELHTSDLCEGFELQSSMADGVANLQPSPQGIAQGFAFGNGTQHDSNPYLDICGGREARMMQYFALNPSTLDEDRNVFRILDIPSHYLQLPDISDTPAFLYGWLAGYFAADGSCDRNGKCVIRSKNEAAIAFVKDVCAVVGIDHGNVLREEHASDCTDDQKPPVFALSLHRETLASSFFLLLQHRANLKAAPALRKTPRKWKVAAVEETGRVEEVFCATVPITRAFVLADNILTGNCAFVSTKDIVTDGAKPFVFLMDSSMLGIGVGFDTKGAGTMVVSEPVPDPSNPPTKIPIPDSRDGWVKSTQMLIESYLFGTMRCEFDYSGIRAAGLPIKSFGGVSSGPAPLIQLHSRIREVLDKNANAPISVTTIVDLMNHIGVCVVSGNVRRSAEIAFGEPDCEEYVDLKNYEKNPQRGAFGWASNNSVFAQIGMDYGPACERVQQNGEPGFAWLENMRHYGRMRDDPGDYDVRAEGGNPCLEQTLEPYEMCCLVESFPAHHETLEDFQRTLKFAYLYAKTVTLGRTHWPETNRVMLRNRRIGCSMSGIAQFISTRGIETLRQWCNAGYETIQYYDRVYSEWFAIPRSIKTTSVKPSGTVSLLAGATPGMHYPISRFYLRRVRLPKDSELIPPLLAAGYHVEPCAGSEETTSVVEFPVDAGEGIRSESEVSMWEQVLLAKFLQREWSDNQVSCTVTFDRETEGPQIKHVLNYAQYHLKGISFLPRFTSGYAQMPYEAISEETFNTMRARISGDPFQVSTTATLQTDAKAEMFCDGDSCVM